MKRWIWIFLFSLNAHGASVDSIRNNAKGIEHLKKENPSMAQREFLEALSREPFNLEYKLNLGLSFEQNKDLEKALKEYLAAEKLATTKEQKFYAIFNAAEVLGKEKKIPQALQMYQKALDINPDSIEVKTNIELLLQQGGGGGGEGQDQQQNQDPNQKQDPKQNDPQQKGQDQQKPQPKPFNSKDLSQEDVRKILEELKNQEQSIRAQEYDKNPKESPNDKDW